MKSLVVTFSAPRTVELREEEIGDPGPGEIPVQTLVSLVSTGTESLCFESDFDADSRWASALRFPHHDGSPLAPHVVDAEFVAVPNVQLPAAYNRVRPRRSLPRGIELQPACNVESRIRRLRQDHVPVV